MESADPLSDIYLHQKSTSFSPPLPCRMHLFIFHLCRCFLCFTPHRNHTVDPAIPVLSHPSAPFIKFSCLPYMDHHNDIEPAQIGRASCRERVQCNGVVGSQLN